MLCVKCLACSFICDAVNVCMYCFLMFEYIWWQPFLYDCIKHVYVKLMFYSKVGTNMRKHMEMFESRITSEEILSHIFYWKNWKLLQKSLNIACRGIKCVIRIYHEYDHYFLFPWELIGKNPRLLPKLMNCVQKSTFCLLVCRLLHIALSYYIIIGR